MRNINFKNINNALEIIKEQQNIILCELLKEFPLGCNITYLNENNIEIDATVINHRVTEDNIPKLDIKTLENKKIKLIPINTIIKKSLSDEVLKKQKIISELSSQFKISNATINDEKRIEIFKAVLLQMELNSLTEFKLSSSIDKEKFVDFLLLDSKLSKPIMSMKFDKFTITLEVFLLPQIVLL